MSVEHFIENLVEGALVIVPGDRPDILVATLASTVSPTIPTRLRRRADRRVRLGRDRSPAARQRAVRGARGSAAHARTAAAAVQTVKPQMRAEDERKIASALGALRGRASTPASSSGGSPSSGPARVTPIMFEYELIERAKASTQHIVLPEGDDDRILRAADILLRRGVVAPHDPRRPGRVRRGPPRSALDLDGRGDRGPARLVAPRRSTPTRYFELRKHKGVTEELALETMADPSYFATMMVHHGRGRRHGLGRGAHDRPRRSGRRSRSSAREGVSVVSSVFLMCLPDRVLVYGDCAVNPKPDPEQLADIAISSAETAVAFGDRAEDRDALLLDRRVRQGRGRRRRARRRRRPCASADPT